MGRLNDFVKSQGDLVDISLGLLSFFQGDEQKVRVWLGTPNPLLGDRKPETFLPSPYLRAKLAQFIKEQLAENSHAPSHIEVTNAPSEHPESR